MTRVVGPLRAPEVLEAVSDPRSRAVLSACVESARAAKDIADVSGVPLTTVYRQVHRLERLAVLVVERSAMTPDGRRYDLYRSRVREVELEVDARGERVRWRENEPIETRLAEMWTATRATVTAG